MAMTYAEKIEYEGLEFLRVRDNVPFYIDQIKSFDGVIIEYSRKDATHELIQKIRRHKDDSIYLVPLFLYRRYDEGDDTIISQLVDGTIQNMTYLSGIAETTRALKNRI